MGCAVRGPIILSLKDHPHVTSYHCDWGGGNVKLCFESGMWYRKVKLDDDQWISCRVVCFHWLFCLSRLLC